MFRDSEASTESKSLPWAKPKGPLPAPKPIQYTESRFCDEGCKALSTTKDTKVHQGNLAATHTPSSIAVLRKPLAAGLPW